MRAPTAYFLFAGEVRPEIQAEIAAQNGGKVSVAAIGKAIGVRWQQLSEEDREKYKARAKQLKEEAQQLEAEEADHENDHNPDEDNNTKSAPPLPPFGLPTSLVKKIACMDPDVSRMSGDATKALAMASALFIQHLASKSLQHATENKRKNFKFSDIDAVARQDHRLVDMGLHEFFKNDGVFEDMHARLNDTTENNHTTSRQKKTGTAEEAQQKIRPLTDFFRQQG